MKLDPKQVRILQAVEMLANAPLSEIAKRTGLRETTVRYQLGELREAGILGTKRAFVNSYLLGYEQYVMYFALDSGRADGNKKFLSALAALPRVWWIAHVGGNYHYAVSIAAKNIQELLDTLEGLCDKHKVSMVQKTISVRASVSRFARKYLASSKEKLPVFTMGRREDFPGVLELDVIDRTILHAVTYRGDKSNRELAEALRIPSSTFDRRISGMQASGLIVGYFYELNLAALGIQQFVLLLQLRGLSKKLRKQLFAFAREHERVRKYVSCVGQWDCELEVNVQDPEQLSGISGELYSLFRGAIMQISTVPLLKHVSTPPFEL